jgi:hypothetical protein
MFERTTARRQHLGLLALFAALSAAARGGCPLEIEGTWKLMGAVPNTPALMSFTADGWANVLGGPSEVSAGDIAAQVSYRLAPAQDPRRIEFDARRGNDLFPPGVSSWEITGHADDSFTARPIDKVAGQQSYWTRLQTHRYFLTFAARSAAAEGAAFVMWTTLDGQKTQLDALGTVQQGGSAHFGRIPDAITRSFATQGDPARDVMMRIELNEAEYRRTRAVHREWIKPPARGSAPEDANARALRFIEATLLGVNRCAIRIQPADALALVETTRAAGAGVPPAQPVELVRTIRRTNDRRHVPDKAFPATWKPAALT